VFHLGDREVDGRIIACVTFFPDDLDGRPAWRFRGMATLEKYRNTGVGGRLLEAGIDEVARRGGTRVWCNGRSSAGDFYRRHGFTEVSDEFIAGPHSIPHFLFARSLSPAG
jgi:predicted GNAT family N-acyltransferase